MNQKTPHTDISKLSRNIKAWGVELGFQQVGISDINLEQAEQRLEAWLARDYQGEMGFMSRHGRKRSRPETLVPGTRRILSVRMDYPAAEELAQRVLDDPKLAYVSRYALGRDYHKLMRNRLQKLALRIEREVGSFGYRVFVDSAPVLEKPIAQKAGLGWIGKHSNLVSRRAGCWFFLGELFTDLPLPVDEPETDHCGSCTDCMEICPTRAIVAPYVVDARRCISYLTIELQGAIPTELRPLMGNRIYGCDDCLLVCPWNRFAGGGRERDFLPRNGLDAPALADLFRWTEDEFLSRLEGSPVRRIGHDRWLRNIAVALGNAPPEGQVADTLKRRSNHPSDMVREHVAWALERQQAGAAGSQPSYPGAPPA